MLVRQQAAQWAAARRAAALAGRMRSSGALQRPLRPLAGGSAPPVPHAAQPAASASRPPQRSTGFGCNGAGGRSRRRLIAALTAAHGAAQGTGLRGVLAPRLRLGARLLLHCRRHSATVRWRWERCSSMAQSSSRKPPASRPTAAHAERRQGAAWVRSGLSAGQTGRPHQTLPAAVAVGGCACERCRPPQMLLSLHVSPSSPAFPLAVRALTRRGQGEGSDALAARLIVGHGDGAAALQPLLHLPHHLLQLQLLQTAEGVEGQAAPEQPARNRGAASKPQTAQQPRKQGLKSRQAQPQAVPGGT